MPPFTLNFDSILDYHTVTIEITLGNQIIEAQEVTMIQGFLLRQFQEVCKKLAQDSRPMKCVMRGNIWNEKAQKMTESKVQFCNNSYYKEFGKE